MALATYTDLQSSIAGWLGRADLTSVIPDFVTLCHQQLMRDLRGHTRLQKRDTAFSLSSEYVAAPTDFLELISIYLNTSPKRTLVYLPNDLETSYFSSSGTPKYIAVVGSTTAGTESFRLGPAPSPTVTATIEYYAKVTFFASGGATNWILTDYPDLYLYGSLLQASGYIGDDPRIPIWKAGYAESLSNAMAAGRRTRWGANGMAVRVA